LVTATLGTVSDEQRVEGLAEEYSKKFMLDYNFPPFSVGEVKPVRGPGRREIGHGALAERALLPVIPSREEFPYALRLVSEVLSSNGSTSMASVCASTLSLMDAGVPIKAPVGGIAMGLVSEGGEYVTLTDILGAEDAFGDMDFKVAGTREFVTALQLDTKLTGIPSEVLIGALTQARDARMVVLDVIQAAIERPREQLNRLAPRVHIEQIPVAKIGELIGPKGKRINEIQSTSGAEISIEDDGRVYIGATDGDQLETALKMIREQMNPVMPQVGERYLGTVVKTTTFGAFISLTPGKDGLLHISRLGRKGQRVRSVEDVVNVGDKLLVEVMEIDRQNRISLKLAEEDEAVPTAPAAGGGDGEER
ncbi:MAG TPA: polyribonucleotide nucleotidyltransferase, partial [Actinomycetes bacterium]